MAKYRQVHTTFWDDGFVVDLTPEEKYFYLYLMTNNNTTQCGIYELPYRIIEMQTGYNRDTVLKLLDRFIEYGKIQYNEPTKEIILTNWGKYNYINSPKVKKCIEKELKEIKHKPFITEYMNSLKRYGIDTVSIDYREEEEKEQEEEQEEEQQQERKVDVDFSKIINFYEQNIGQISPILSQKLMDLVDTHNINLIIDAFTRAITAQASNKFSYADKILKNWKEKNILTVKQLKVSEVVSSAKYEKYERATEPTAYDNLWG